MIIQFDRLKDGSHRLDWSGRIAGVDLAYPDIEADVVIKSRVDRLGNVITFAADISCEFDRPCDRTLESAHVMLDAPLRFVVQLRLPGAVTEAEEDDVDILTLSSGSADLDLMDILREHLAVQMPLAFYKEGTDVVATGDDPSENEDDDIDPRWAGLKSVKF
jgi:uncharacterized metal-binding protein YceD (DUF177 family)